MNGIRWGAPAWLLVGGVLIAAALVGASLLVVPGPPQRQALPSAGELMELEPYLDPVETTLPESAGVPESVVLADDPFIGGTTGSAMAGDPSPGSGMGREADGAVAESPRWQLSAVMMAGERRIAILNDQMVRPGDRLEGGVRVAVVERDHIVIIMPDGERRRLELER